MPGGGFIFSQVGFGQRPGQVPPGAHLLTVRRQPGRGGAILEQDIGGVLIMGAVDAIGKMARGVGDADGRLSHKIRLSDFHPLSTRRHAYGLGGGEAGVALGATITGQSSGVIFF